MVVEDCEALANFYDGLIKQVATFSFKLDSESQLNTSPGWKVHPFSGNFQQFVKEANETITTYYDSHRRENHVRLGSFLRRCQDSNQEPQIAATSVDGEEDTWIFPMIQMGPLNIGLDNAATSKIFQDAEPGSNIKLATGYFNLTSDYIEKIVTGSKADFDILMAHPQV